jgi:hypothetical protein
VHIGSRGLCVFSTRTLANCDGFTKRCPRWSDWFPRCLFLQNSISNRVQTIIKDLFDQTDRAEVTKEKSPGRTICSTETLHLVQIRRAVCSQAGNRNELIHVRECDPSRGAIDAAFFTTRASFSRCLKSQTIFEPPVRRDGETRHD